MTMEGFFYSEEEEQSNRKQKKKLKLKKKNVNYPTGKKACRQCKLYKQKGLYNPKLEPYGKFKRKILVIGEAPGRIEDEEGKPFHPDAQAGGMFHKHCKKVGINLYRDCLIINACDCRPKKGDSNRTPTDKEVRCCYYRKKEVIEKYKPRIIILLGDKAKKSFYSFDSDRREFSSIPLRSLNGQIVPDKNSNAWIFFSYHPSFINRGNSDLESVFSLTFANVKKVLDRKRPSFKDFKQNIIVLHSYHEAMKTLNDIQNKKLSFTFDYESSSYRYYEDIHEIYMSSIHIGNMTYLLPFDFPREDGSPWWNIFQRKRIFDLWRRILEDKKIIKYAQNLKHESLASYYIFDADVKEWGADTMLDAHILNEEKDVTQLKRQAYLRYGLYNYSLPDSVMSAEPKRKNNFSKISIDQASEYCGIDSKVTNAIKNDQKKELRKRKLIKASKLFRDGAQAFSVIERNGIKINVKLAERLDRVWYSDLKELKDKILSSKEARKFENRKGRQLKYQKKLSDDDLRILLFDILKFKPINITSAGKYSVKEEVLAKYKSKSRLIKYELEYRKLNKMKNTYLSQFLRFNVDGFIYPSFNLNFARSFRSSSSEPNFQNIPKRLEDAKEIRQLIITRWGSRGFLSEVDYGSMEVRIIACITKDPALIDYIIGGGDMHGDWAEIIFKIKKNEISEKEFKKYRYIAKNHWVFPLFYGSWYRSVAQTTDRPKWFKSYDHWEEHLKQCEKKFWKQFKGVREWQDRSIEQYKRRGYIKDQSWGFERHGYLTRNKLYNFPIQGPAYHCLQWTINELWRKNFFNFESLLCGQIHDALFWDCLRSEFPKVKKKVHYLMTEKIREDNPWIIVPLIDEWTTGPNWAKMEDHHDYKRILTPIKRNL